LNKARHLYEETLAIREELLGPRAVATGDVLYDLAYSLYRLGEPQHAAETAARAVDIYTLSASNDDERMLSAMNVRALSLSAAGNLIQARGYFEQLVPLIERSLGPRHRRFSAVLINLANVKIELEDYDGVEQHLRRAIAIDEQLFGPYHGNLAHAWLDLGILFRATGRFPEALSALERAIDIQRQVSGPGHEVEGAAHNQLGRVYHARGDLKAALAHLQLALDINRKALGATHWRYAMALQDFGEVQMETGNLQLASESLRNALAILHNNPEVMQQEMITLAIMARLQARTGTPAEGEAQARKALAYHQKNLPPEHSLIAVARGVLGECLLAQGRIPEAEEILLDSSKRLGNQEPAQQRLILQSLIQLYERKADGQAVSHFRGELAAFERKVRA
jgi:tetratricopeptide (TPR) repeat protein